MKIFGFNSKNRKYLLPLVMLSAVFFIFQGIRLPDLSNPQEPKLSSSQKVEQSTSAVVKTLLQSTQVKAAKAAQFFDLFTTDHQFKHPVVYISASQFESHSFASATITVRHARAPPA